MIQPGHEFRFEAADIDVSNAYLSREGLRDAARVAFGDDRMEVVFDGPSPKSQALGRHVQVLTGLAISYSADGRLRSPLLRASLFHSLAMSALVCFSLASEVEQRRLSPSERLRRFRMATAFIDQHASLPITSGDVARATGATLAQLDAAFREYTGAGLAAYRQRTRLAAAHEEIIASSTVVDMDELATRWGFPDAERFLRRYRESYGEPPLD